MATPTDDPIALKLRDARKAQHYTQETVALAAGISRSALVAIEAGGDCTLSTLRKLCEVLDLTFNLEASTERAPTLDDVTEENRSRFFESPS